MRRTDPQCSVLDLKARCQGYKYMTEVLNLLPEAPDEDLIAQLFRQVAQLAGFILSSRPSTPPNWRRYRV